jgi:hypothetical protein
MHNKAEKVDRPGPPAESELSDLQSQLLQNALHGTFDSILFMPVPEPLLRLLVGANRADEQNG